MRQETHLRDLVRALGWSYASLWSPASSATTALVWTDGCFEASPLKRYDPNYWNVEELYNSSNQMCSFATNSGYAAKVLMQGQPLWLTGTDALVRNSHTSAQAQFFRVAGIQTLLCIPWFNSVVEVGSTQLVPENSNLLLQIRAFLSHMPAAKQHQEANALSPVQGPLVSQGLSPSDDVSDGVNQLEPCSPFPLDVSQQNLQSAAEESIQEELLRHWEADQHEVTEVSRQSLAMGHDLNEMGDREWGLEFASTESQGLKTSPRSTLQFKLSHEQERQPQSVTSDSSFLLSPRQQMPLLSQLNYNQAKSSSENSQSSSDGDPLASNRRQENLHFRGSVSSKSAALAFKPWKSRKGSESPEMRQSNQVVLQQSINMTHKLSRLNGSDSPFSEHRAMGMGRHSIMEARDVPSHDEAAVNHMLAERKRRQKQKENFAALRALIPFVSKMDRASILGDAINYMKQLTSRVQELETLNRELQAQLPQYIHKSFD